MEGDIVITLSPSEYHTLLLMMGYAAGEAYKQDEALFNSFLHLANRVNAGNSAWTPYITIASARYPMA